MVSAKRIKNTCQTDEESVLSTKRSYGPGEDIIGKYDPDKLVEDGPTDNSSYDDEEDTEDEDEEDEDEEEEDILGMKKKHKMRPWDVLVNIVAENLQDTFNETVAGIVAEFKIRTYKKLKKWHMRK